MEIQEFTRLKYERDKYYFGIGFICYNVYWRKKKFYVNAVYRDDAIMKNEQTLDYSNGIKGFEILDDKFRMLKKIKIGLKSKVINLKEVENYIINNC